MRKINNLSHSAKRFLGGVGAHIYAQGVTILIQVISLPIFLHFWSATDYGIWLTISAVPLYLSISDFGVFAYAANKMTMAAAKKDYDELNLSFSNALTSAVFVLPSIFVVASLFVYFFRNSIGWDATLALFCLMASALLNCFCQIYDACFRAFGKYPQVTIVLTTARIFEWLGSILGLVLFKSFFAVAFGALVFRVLLVILLFLYTRYCFKIIEWRIGRISRFGKEGFSASMGLLAFPLGELMTLQGSIFLINIFLGPLAVATYSALRTISRVVMQISLLTCKSLSPELSFLCGAGNYKSAYALMRRVKLYVFPFSFSIGVVIYFLGDQFISYWSGGKISYDSILMFLLLLNALLSAYWRFESLVLISSNTHQKFSKFYLFVNIFLWILLTGFFCFDLIGLRLFVLFQVCGELAIFLYLARFNRGA